MASNTEDDDRFVMVPYRIAMMAKKEERGDKDKIKTMAKGDEKKKRMADVLSRINKESGTSCLNPEVEGFDTSSMAQQNGKIRKNKVQFDHLPYCTNPNCERS